MKPDGTDQKNLTNTPSVGEWEFTWSPDGSKLAYIRDSAIYVMNADCTNPVNITSAATPKLWGPPVWSPDGTKIAFHACLGKSGQDCDIYVMNADGTKKPVNITNRPEVYYGFGTDAGHTLDWQPLPGKKTVYPPDTGGPSLLLVASALLISVGVLLNAVVRRKM